MRFSNIRSFINLQVIPISMTIYKKGKLSRVISMYFLGGVNSYNSQCRSCYLPVVILAVYGNSSQVAICPIGEIRDAYRLELSNTLQN